MASIETLILEIIARDKGASAAFDQLRRKIDDTTGSVDKNSRSLQQNQKAQTSAMGGAVGLGVALGAMATPLVAAGAGFIAFAGVALPSVMKVKTAMTGPGGLTAAWGTLDKGQRNAAVGIQMLGQRYSALTKAMEPQIFQVFNQGLHLASTLLGPVAQLAASAGKGISSFLAQFTASSGIQQFISFLAKEAGPAIMLLGQDITGIAHAVFTLLESFGGVGIAELKAFTVVLTGLTSGISWLATHAGGLTSVALGIGGIAFALSKLGLLTGTLKLTGLTLMAGELGAVAGAAKGATLAEKGLLATNAVFDSLTPFGWAVLATAAVGGLVFWLSRFKDATGTAITAIEQQNKATGFNTQGYKNAAAAIGQYAQASKGATVQLVNLHTGMVTGTATVGQLSGATKAATGEQAKLTQGIQQQNRFLGVLQGTYGLTHDQAAKLAQVSGVLVDKQGRLKDGFAQSIAKAKAYADANLNAQGPTSQLAADMSVFANKTLDATTRTKALTTALNLFFNPAVTADQAVIQLKNDQAALATALAASGGKTGLLTQKQRDARSAFDTYINDVATAAQKAFDATGKTSSYTKIIDKSLPFLKRAAGGNKTLRQEIQKLIDTERGIKAENVIIHVAASGKWAVIGPGGGLPGGTAGGPFAAGGMIRGGVSGRDSVPIMAMPGEVVVPTDLVARGAVDHLRGRLPGFASGGVVGSFGGSVPGLTTWLKNENTATVVALANATARALLTGVRSFFTAGGPGGGNPAMNARLARLMMPSWAFGSAWNAWNYVAMRESGWNQFARNPSSGAYGIPQALPPSKMGAAANPPQSSPVAQIAWMIPYIQGRYGSPQAAAQHEARWNWYDQGGWLPPGPSWVYNGTGRPERVLPPGGGDGCVTINIYPPVTSNPRAIAREIADILNQGAVAGGRLRKSILSANG